MSTHETPPPPSLVIVRDGPHISFHDKISARELSRILITPDGFGIRAARILFAFYRDQLGLRIWNTEGEEMLSFKPDMITLLDLAQNGPQHG